MLRIVLNIASVVIGGNFPMYVCHCNPFSEKDAQTYLESKAGQTVTLRDIYKGCTGGAKPPCGIACIPRLTAMLEKHNRAIEVNNGAVSKSLESVTVMTLAQP